MATDYGTPGGLHHEPGAPAPVIVQQAPEPPSRLQLAVTGVAAAGATVIGSGTAWTLVGHGYAGYGVIVAVASVIGVVEAVKAGVHVETPDVPEPSAMERERILKRFQRGKITEFEAARLLKAVRPDSPKLT